MEIPSTWMSPDWGSNKPKMRSTKVVFPAPDLPIKAIESPFLIVIEISTKEGSNDLG